MKMAASFHQRVVVGEDKPMNNNTSRDHHRTPRDSTTKEDRMRVYQEKTREVYIFDEPFFFRFITHFDIESLCNCFVLTGTDGFAAR